MSSKETHLLTMGMYSAGKLLKDQGQNSKVIQQQSLSIG